MSQSLVSISQRPWNGGGTVTGFKILLAIIEIVCLEARVKVLKTLIFGLKPISPLTVPLSRCRNPLQNLKFLTLKSLTESSLAGSIPTCKGIE